VKAKSLILNNIQCHRDKRFKLAKLTMFVGPNDTGKSTIGNAIEALLSNQFSHQYGTGNGKPSALVSHGESLGSITIELEKGGQITRSTDGVLTCSWKPRAKASESAHELEHLMGCTLDRARLCLNGQRYFRMDQRDQKALLQDILGLEITSALIVSELSQRGAGLVDELARVAGPQSNWINFGFCHKRLYEERTGAKKLLDDAQRRHAAAEKALAETVYLAEADLRKALDAEVVLLQKQAQLQQKRGEMAMADRLVMQQEERLKQLEATYPKPEPLKVDETPEVLEDRIAKCQVLLQKLLEDRSKRRRLLECLESREMLLENARLQLREVREHTEVPAPCHKCGALSPYAESFKASLLWRDERISGEISLLQKEAEGIQAEIDAIDPTLEDRIKKGHSKISELHGLKEKARETVRLFNEAKDRVRVTELARQALQEAQEARQALGSSEALTEELVALEIQLREARETKAAWDAYEFARTAENRASNDMARYRHQVDCLAILEPFYKPDGFQLEHSRGRMGGFEEMLNRYLEPFGLQGRYSADLTFELSRDGAPFVPITRAADSGTILAGWAHQMCFAEYTGLGIVSVDRIESIEPSRRRQLVEYCANAPGPDHIFLMGSIEVENKPEGALIYELKLSPERAVIEGVQP